MLRLGIACLIHGGCPPPSTVGMIKQGRSKVAKVLQNTHSGKKWIEFCKTHTAKTMLRLKVTKVWEITDKKGKGIEKVL